jgi:hypothetical protein
MQRPSFTLLLWAANAAVLAVGLTYAGILGGRLVFGGPAELPAIRTLAVPPAPTFPTIDGLGERNPFDPSGTPWSAAGEKPGAPASTGALKGVILLPGVRVAVTDDGVLRPGDRFQQGRLKTVQATGVEVDTANGARTLKTPGADRPRLQDINRAVAPARNEGKP